MDGSTLSPSLSSRMPRLAGRSCLRMFRGYRIGVFRRVDNAMTSVSIACFLDKPHCRAGLDSTQIKQHTTLGEHSIERMYTATYDVALCDVDLMYGVQYDMMQGSILARVRCTSQISTSGALGVIIGKHHSKDRQTPFLIGRYTYLTQVSVRECIRKRESGQGTYVLCSAGIIWVRYQYKQPTLVLRGVCGPSICIYDLESCCLVQVHATLVRSPYTRLLPLIGVTDIAR